MNKATQQILFATAVGISLGACSPEVDKPIEPDKRQATSLKQGPSDEPKAGADFALPPKVKYEGTVFERGEISFADIVVEYDPDYSGGNVPGVIN